MADSSTFLEVTRELKIDHDNVRDLFTRYVQARHTWKCNYKNCNDANEKKAIANTMVRERVIHGDAAEMAVYHVFDQAECGARRELNQEEHAKVKNIIQEADPTDLTEERTDDVIIRAATAFLRHADEEENQQFNMIRNALTPQENDTMAKEFLKARTTVASRPQAKMNGDATTTEAGHAQRAVGMRAPVMEKMVESIEGRKFVELKYHHAI